MHGSEHVCRRQALTDFRSHSNRWIWVRLCESEWVWVRGAVCACAVDNTCKCACVWMRSQYNQVAQAALPVQKLIFSGTRVQSVKRTRYKTKVNKSNKKKKIVIIDGYFRTVFCDIELSSLIKTEWNIEFSICVRLYLPLEVVTQQRWRCHGGVLTLLIRKFSSNNESEYL